MNGIKKYRIQIITATAIVILFTIVVVSLHEQKRKEKQLETAIISNLRASITDSIKTYMNLQKIVEIEAIKAQEEKKTDEAKRDAPKWKKTVEFYKKENIKLKSTADSLAITKPECKDIADAYTEVIDSLEKQSIAQDSLCAITKMEAKSYEYRLLLTEQQLGITKNIVSQKDSTLRIKENLIRIYEKQAKKTWWNKNKFWVGLGAGMIGGVAIFK